MKWTRRGILGAFAGLFAGKKAMATTISPLIVGNYADLPLSGVNGLPFEEDLYAGSGIIPSEQDISRGGRLQYPVRVPIRAGELVSFDKDGYVVPSANGSFHWWGDDVW